MAHFYMSFATGEKFLGSTVVKAQDEEDAVRVATEMGRNPGGEIIIVAVPKVAMGEPDVQVLLTKLVGEEEALAMGYRKAADDSELAKRIGKVATQVCSDCNPVAVQRAN